MKNKRKERKIQSKTIEYKIQSGNTNIFHTFRKTKQNKLILQFSGQCWTPDLNNFILFTT